MKMIRFLAALMVLAFASTAYAGNNMGLLVTMCTTPGGCPTIVATPSATPTPIANNTNVVRTLDFVNTLGANTKLIQGEQDVQQTINAVNYTGVKHLRDTASVFLGPNRFGGNYSEMCQIAQASGADFIVLPAAFGFENTPTSQNNIQIAQSTLEYLATCGALDSTYITGQNEYNNSDTPWLGADCPNGGSYWACEQFQQAFYAMVHSGNSNAMCTGPGTTYETTTYGGGPVTCCTGLGTGTCPDISHHLVISGSDVGAESDNVGLQFLTIPAANATGNGNGTTNIPLNCCSANGNSGSGNIIAGTKIADVADTHNYIQNNSRNILDNMSRYASALARTGPDAGSWDTWGEFWGGTAVPFPTAPCGGNGCDSGTWGSNRPIGQLNYNFYPKVSTETGWTIFNPPSGVTLTMQGNMVVDHFLDQLQAGFLRTWMYLQINTPSDGGYGFFDTNATIASIPAGDQADGSNATPLGVDMHNLTTILADTTANFTPTAPSGLAISGLTVPSPGNNDSVNYPSMYYNQIMEKSSGTYELVLWGESFVSQINTTGSINLGRAYSTVKIYDVGLSTVPQQTFANTQNVSVTLKDHPIIVEFR